jgi:hypothetical protein
MVLKLFTPKKIIYPTQNPLLYLSYNNFYHPGGGLLQNGLNQGKRMKKRAIIGFV